jgi:hypothetical protein
MGGMAGVMAKGGSGEAITRISAAGGGNMAGEVEPGICELAAGEADPGAIGGGAAALCRGVTGGGSAAFKSGPARNAARGMGALSPEKVVLAGGLGKVALVAAVRSAPSFTPPSVAAMTGEAELAMTGRPAVPGAAPSLEGWCGGLCCRTGGDGTRLAGTPAVKGLSAPFPSEFWSNPGKRLGMCAVNKADAGKVMGAVVAKTRCRSASAFGPSGAAGSLARDLSGRGAETSAKGSAAVGTEVATPGRSKVAGPRSMVARPVSMSGSGCADVAGNGAEIAADAPGRDMDTGGEGASACRPMGGGVSVARGARAGICSVAFASWAGSCHVSVSIVKMRSAAGPGPDEGTGRAMAGASSPKGCGGGMGVTFHA